MTSVITIAAAAHPRFCPMGTFFGRKSGLSRDRGTNRSSDFRSRLKPLLQDRETSMLPPLSRDLPNVGGRVQVATHVAPTVAVRRCRGLP